MAGVSVRSRVKLRGFLAASLIILGLLFIAMVAITIWSNDMSGNLMTHTLFEPLDGMTTAKVSINPGDGNLEIDSLTGGEQILAGCTLQYFEKQGLPNRSMVIMNGQANLTLEPGSGKQSWLRLPWAACNGATVWKIHLNPMVVSDLTAHSDGGNIKLNLVGMTVTHVSADTGGGNIDLILPDNAASLSVTARTGAGNVTVDLPGGVAVRVRVSLGLGKAIIDPRFSQVEKNTYQTPGFDQAAGHLELTADSGAGNVIIRIR
jgi:hypothetical protein